MASVVQPHAWVGFKLPSENVRFLQVVPNTMLSLGKYGTFPSNLIIDRPFHLTYELQDRREGESFCRLRIVPPAELHAEALADEARGRSPEEGDDVDEDEDGRGLAGDGEGGATPVDIESQAVIVRSNQRDAGGAAGAGAAVAAGGATTVPQMLSNEEILQLKREGTDAGRGLIAQLLRSHAALDQKTAFSLAKYKLLKTKKYLRRFSVLPLDVCSLGNWLLGEKDAGSKILELRDEMIGLLGCWANVHYGGPDRYLDGPSPAREEAGDEGRETTKKEEGADDSDAAAAAAAPGEEQPAAHPQQQEQAPEAQLEEIPPAPDLSKLLAGGRWLVVDDTGGLLVAAMAERMGVLYPGDNTGPVAEEKHAKAATEADVTGKAEATSADRSDGATAAAAEGEPQQTEEGQQSVLPSRPGSSSGPSTQQQQQQQQQQHGGGTKRRARDDFHVPFSLQNTLTVVHANMQPNLTYLKYFGFDYTDPSHGPHPLADHVLCLSWLQLLAPERDGVYGQAPAVQPADVLAEWKPARRGNYHRKRRRWARTRHVVDAARAGGFSGLVVATTLDLVSTLRHTLPLLAGGSAVAVYSPTLEPLTRLADCFSVARRAAWSGAAPPEGVAGQSPAALERWPGTEAFPLNPMLLLGVSVQTSRARRWQVLPGRTHPLMTARGGAEGYVLTGYKARPAEGRVTARGRFKKRKTEEGA